MMTKEQFTAQVLAAEDILFKAAMSILRTEHDAEDAMQSAVLKAYEKISTLKDDKLFRTWLIRILINECRSQLRCRKKTAPYPETQQTSASLQEETEVRAAVESLPVKLRQVVILYYSEQFTTKEIGSILKIPHGTVLSRLDKARKLLRIDLTQN